MGQSGAIVASLRPAHRIGIDTSIFIYYIGQGTAAALAARAVLRAVSDGRFEGITSVITLFEVTAKSLRLGRPEVADAYETPISKIPDRVIAELDRKTTRVGAELRARHGPRTPDSMQIAACLVYSADVFLTNDRRLRRVNETDVRVLAELA